MPTPNTSRALIVAFALLVPGASLAQTAAPTAQGTQGAPGAPGSAQDPGALAPGVARDLDEAPGARRLAVEPVMPAEQMDPRPGPAPRTPGAAASDPASERSMSFAAGSGQCRDTVPGGPMLAIAYAVVLLVLGAYVVLLANKNIKLARAIDELEEELGRKRPEREDAR